MPSSASPSCRCSPASKAGDEPLDGPQILASGAAARGGRRGAPPRARRPIPPCPELARRLAGSDDPSPLLAEVDRVLDRKGQVRDDASPRLGELARQVRTSRDRLYARLEQVRGAHAEAFTEETVPLRGGRLLLMLSSGARGRVPGLVHGRSASGRSFYFEPLEAVEENNSLATASEELEAERQRILRELLAAFARAAPLVQRLADFVAGIDALEAAGRFAHGDRRPAAGARAGAPPAPRRRLSSADRSAPRGAARARARRHRPRPRGGAARHRARAGAPACSSSPAPTPAARPWR